MFGGQAKNMQRKHRLRRDINVLSLGDFGTAKSKFLNGQFTQQVKELLLLDLQVVHKDPITREWTLEGGMNSTNE
ncbi:DNA replication licensing factor MCM2 [Tanacetum coccineum]